MTEEQKPPAELDISLLLRINEFKIAEELCTCSSYFYSVSSLAVEAEDMYEAATIAVETYEVQLAASYKQADEDVKETHIKRLYRADLKWNELHKQQLKIRKQWKLLQKAALAFEMKSKMLMSLNRRDLFKRGQVEGNSNSD